MSNYADTQDPVALLNRAPDTSGGPTVEDAVKDAGIEVQAVDWVWRKVVGESLVKTIIEPITGDFEKIAQQAGQWANVCDALQAVRNNLNSGLQELGQSWTGEAANSFKSLIGTQWTVAIEADAQAAKLIGMALNKVAEGSKKACDQCLNLIKKLVDKLIEAAAMLPIPVVGWARAVKLVYDGIELYNAIMQLIEGIKAIIEGAQQVIEGIKQVGSALAKLKDVRDLNDLINVANETGEGVATAKGGVDSIKDGFGDVKEGATSAASAASNARSHATSPSSNNQGNDGTSSSSHNGDGTTPASTTTDPGSDKSRTDKGATANRPDDPNSTKTPADKRNTCGDPVDVVSGEMVLAQSDVELSGVLPLILRRTHVSGYRVGRLFGRSWASTVDQRLEVDRDGAVFVGEDGMRLVYPAAAIGATVLPVAGPRWPLARSASGYALTMPQSDHTLLFPERATIDRPLSAVVDRNGNRIDFDRDETGTLAAIRHSGGYHVAVDTTQGRVAGMRLRKPDGPDVPLVRFRYDAAENLTEVINSSGRALKFDYDAQGRIIQWTDRNGEWYRYQYDETGRCVSNEGSGGFLNGTFVYLDRTTRYTNALGHTTIYLYNDRNQVVAETDPLGNTTTSEWDQFDRLLSRTDPLGRTTSYTYDADGNLTAIAHPDGNRTLAEYALPGRPHTIIDADGAVWRREYDERGNLTAVTDPAGATTRYAFDERGGIQRITDAAGKSRTQRSNPAGLPIAETDQLGATTRFARDLFGRVVAITDPAGGVTRCSWTVEGKLTMRSRPGGATERWRYDGEGNEVEYVDPLGQVSRTRTTHFDLPAVRTNPDGSQVTYTYDPTLQVTAVTDGQGVTWRFDRDALGRVVRETDSTGRELLYTYDPAGQLVTQVNGAGQRIAYHRNVIGDVIRTDADGVSTEFRYDAMGRLVNAVNPDAVVQFERDALGRVVRETVNDESVTSEYDVLGRRVARTTPTGAHSRWDYDGRDQHAGLRTAGHSMTFAYDPTGREIERLLDTGTTLTQTWTADHRLSSQTVTGGPGRVQHRQFRYRADGGLVSIEDQLAGTRRFDLDPAGRVLAATGPAGPERYAYDAVGNITAANWPTADAETQGPRQYAATAIRGAGAVHYERDAQGRVTLRQKRRLSAKPATWRYLWNAEDRLVGVITPDGTRWRYRYDPLGRRIAKERLATDGSIVEWVRFSWDGTTLAEQTTSAGRATTWDWTPGTDRPVTQVERVHAATAEQGWVDEQFYSIVSDLVGTPTELVATDGTVAWKLQTTVWGQALSALASRANTPLRFPGQYYDTETGLHYNNQRYYDPEIGQYLSADPLGTSPGPNQFAYAANPFTGMDPLGLLSCEEKIDNYREQYKVGKGRNIAVSEHNINGQSGGHVATSRDHQYPGAVPATAHENRQFVHGRDSDAEGKMMEHYAATLPEGATGTIHITSERPVCDSCQDVIDQFRQKFPGITVTYSDLGRR